MGFRKADDFYIALGGAKISPKTVVNKVLHAPQGGRGGRGRDDDGRGPRLDAARAPPAEPLELAVRHPRRGRRRRHAAPGQVLPPGAGRPDRRLHLARPRHHDPPRGLPERRARCARTPSASSTSSWEGDHETSFKVEIEVDAYDRTRLLEELSRTFAESGINIVEARCVVSPPMVKNRFVVEVGDTQTLKTTITRLRNIDSVFDAYRVTPTG